MKKISLYITSLVLSTMALSSCSDNWERPPMDVPTYPEGFKATMTIAELKAKYWQDTETYGTLVGKENGEDIYIAGTVTSSTAAGNIYKTLTIQDATGAITIGIDTTKIETVYPRGIGMAVNVTGLAIGRYNGLMQLGKMDGSSVNRITNAAFNPHTMLDFYSGKLDTITTSISELEEAARTTEGKIQWQSKLIRINHVKFVEAGQPFTNGSTTSRYIIDDEGNRMIVYNSSYADFAYNNLPYGHGDIVGILSCYRSSWQLLLIDEAGCIDFDGEGAPDPNLKTIFEEAFSTASLGGFTEEIVSKDDALSYIWSGTDKYGAKASSFVGGGAKASDGWLVSPAIDLAGCESPVVLTFSHACNKFGSIEGMKQEATLGVREEGSTTWTAVTIPTYSNNDAWDFVESGDIDLSAFAGKKIQIGFHYVSTTSSAGTWEIKNVKLTAIKK